MTITTFRKVYVDNLISWDHDRTVKGYVYLTSDQDFPKANDYIEDHLYILHDENSDKPFHLLLDRSDYQSNHLIDLETMLFDWANGEYHDGTYRIVEVSNND